MNVIKKLEKLERNRLEKKEASYFKPMVNVKPYRRLTIWDHITRVSLFVVCFLIGLALGYVFFSGLFFYAVKIVSNIK